MKFLFFTLLVSIIVVQSNVSMACSYVIDEPKKIEELQRVALANLGEKDVMAVQAYGFSYFESKPTPMCPDELTYEASYDVVYKYGLNKCFATVKVKKIESWIDDSDSYIVTGVKSSQCEK